MYPHVVQFETRRLDLEQWFQLNRDRRQARTLRQTIEPCVRQSSRRVSIASSDATSMRVDIRGA